MNHEETNWAEAGLACPHCGNSGEAKGSWERNSSVPFKLIEDVIRSWKFSVTRGVDGTTLLLADTATDSVDWESGLNTRLECMECFDQFPLPEGFGLDYV